MSGTSQTQFKNVKITRTSISSGIRGGYAARNWYFLDFLGLKMLFYTGYHLLSPLRQHRPTPIPIFTYEDLCVKHNNSIPRVLCML